MTFPDTPDDPAGGAGDENRPAGRDRIALVTGSTSGLGRVVARRLADLGFHVLLHGRDRGRGAALAEEIAVQARGSARFLRADLASLDEVRGLAEGVRDGHDRLDVLVNNAGVYPDERTLSRDGHELGFQVNHLAPFLLTLRLLPLLRGAAPARVVNVSSGAQRAIDLDDPMMEEGYSNARSYAQSKLAQVLFTFALARRVEADGVLVNALHPATYMDTRMVRSLDVRPRSTVEEGADAVMRLITDDDPGTGGYFDGAEPARAHGQAYDRETQERLWRLSERLAGV